MHLFSNQHHSVYFKCGGVTYVSVSASACKNVRLASRTMSCLSSLTRFWQCCSSAHHLTNECQWWCSCEVTASPFLFDLMRDQSTSHIHTLVFTFVDVSPSTRNGFASCPQHACLICYFFESLELVVPFDIFPSCFGHVVSEERHSCHFVNEISFTFARSMLPLALLSSDWTFFVHDFGLG